MFIIAQIIGGIVLILTVISVQFKTKEKILICQIVANILVAIQYFLLNAITGAVISIINAIRCVIFYYYKKKDIKPSVIILIIFEVIAIISGIYTWQDIWSLIPIVVTVVYTYGLWQDNVTVIRITAGVVGFGWAVYNVIVMAYVGALQETAQLVSSVIAIFRNKQKLKE